MILKICQNIKLVFCVFIFFVCLTNFSYAREYNSYVTVSTGIAQIYSLGNSTLDVTNGGNLESYSTGFDIENKYLSGLDFSLGLYVSKKVSLESQFSLFNKIVIKNAQFVNKQTGDVLQDLSQDGLIVQSFSFATIYDFYQKENITLQGGFSIGMLYFEDGIADYKWLFEDDQIYYGLIARALYDLNNRFALILSYNLDYSKNLHDIHKIEEIHYKQENCLNSYLAHRINFGLMVKIY